MAEGRDEGSQRAKGKRQQIREIEQEKNSQRQQRGVEMLRESCCVRDEEA